MCFTYHWPGGEKFYIKLLTAPDTHPSLLIPISISWKWAKKERSFVLQRKIERLPSCCSTRPQAQMKGKETSWSSPSSVTSSNLFLLLEFSSPLLKSPLLHVNLIQRLCNWISWDLEFSPHTLTMLEHQSWLSWCSGLIYILKLAVVYPPWPIKENSSFFVRTCWLPCRASVLNTKAYRGSKCKLID